MHIAYATEAHGEDENEKSMNNDALQGKLCQIFFLQSNLSNLSLIFPDNLYFRSRFSSGWCRRRRPPILNKLILAMPRNYSFLITIWKKTLYTKFFKIPSLLMSSSHTHFKGSIYNIHFQSKFVKTSSSSAIRTSIFWACEQKWDLLHTLAHMAGKSRTKILLKSSEPAKIFILLHINK